MHQLSYMAQPCMHLEHAVIASDDGHLVMVTLDFITPTYSTFQSGVTPNPVDRDI